MLRADDEVTLLKKAISKGNVGMVEHLLDNGKDFVFLHHS